MQKLYIIHGWTYKPEPWLEVIECLKKHQIDAELLRVPGLGTKTDESYTIEDYAKWAAKHIPKGSIALGHSNGGRILLNMLNAEGSDYLKGLILLDSAGIYEESTKRNMAKVLSKTFAPLKKSKVLRKAFHKVVGASDYDAAPENMKVTLDNMLNSDKTLKLDGITTPTQIIWGTDDNITPPRQGKKMHELLQNSELDMKEGWRHSRYLVDTQELADVIAEKVKKLTGGKA